jgi:hypothetical protein
MVCNPASLFDVAEDMNLTEHNHLALKLPLTCFAAISLHDDGLADTPVEVRAIQLQHMKPLTTKVKGGSR